MKTSSESKKRARPALRSFSIPSKSGKSGVRHLLRTYDEGETGFTEVDSNLTKRNGSRPEFVRDAGSVIEDGSVTLMFVAHSLPSSLIWLGSWDIFWKLSQQLRTWCDSAELDAYVVSFDKPNKELSCRVPEQKKAEQDDRDEKLHKKHIRLANQLLSEGERAHESRTNDPKSTLWIELKPRILAFCRGEDPGVLFADLMEVAFSETEGMTLPSILWTILIADRRSRQSVLRHFVRDETPWSKLATIGNPDRRFYIDWNEGPKYNEIGEADGSWAAWIPTLRDSGAKGSVVLLTVDTDVALLSLLWRSCHYDGTDLHVCFLRAGAPGHLFMHVNDCWNTMRDLWHSRVDTFVRDAVFCGASDFTSAERHKGITIVRMLEAARQMRFKEEGETDQDLLKFTYDGRDNKPKKQLSSYAGSIEDASKEANWVMGYWHKMLAYSWGGAFEEDSAYEF